MKKTLLILSVCLAMSICGCDSKSNDKNSKSTTASTTESVDKAAENADKAEGNVDKTTESVDKAEGNVDKAEGNVEASATEAPDKAGNSISNGQNVSDVGIIDAQSDVQGSDTGNIGRLGNDDMGIKLDLNTPDESVSKAKNSGSLNKNTDTTKNKDTEKSTDAAKNKDTEKNTNAHEKETAGGDAPIELPFVPVS